MRINRQKKEMALKIVYYGPGYSGKTTNLEQIYSTVPNQLRSSLTTMQNKGDRTLFFDYMQLSLGKIGGLTPRFNLYTVPGQVQYAATRKIVLRGTDAVVFVADSGMARIKDNVYSWRQLHKQLIELNINPRELPIIVQFNKRDLPDALPTTLMRKMFRLPETKKFFEAQAHQNIGTRETLQAAVKHVFQRIQQAKA